MENDPRFIGRVRQILGSRVTVELDRDLAGVSPIYEGRLQSVGQVGSLVIFTQGIVDLIGSVSLVGISDKAGPLVNEPGLHSGERWLEVQLLGQVNKATAEFQRGVSSYPNLDDPVLFATARDLVTVFPSPGDRYVRLGRLASSERVPVALDAAKLVTRHSAIVGSTGSGKTSAVAAVIQNLANGGWSAANIVVVDPHGEYSTALRSHASVRSVLGSGEAALRVPYWALPAADILRAFTGLVAGPSTLKTFGALVTEARQEYVDKAAWISLDPSAITADTPVPFDLKSVWHRLDYENRETRNSKNDPTTAAVVDAGDPNTLTSAQFEPYGAAGSSPHQGPSFGLHGGIPEALRLGMQDPRLAFLFVASDPSATTDPLQTSIQEWLGGERPVSVLDFSGVPHGASELAIGVIAQLIFETAVRTDPDGPGIGRPHPVLLVLEEAHRYLGDGAADIARDAVNRIAREGRKYGVGLMIVTQRPSEIPETALAQVGTLVSLRLTNGADQSRVKSALPDNVAGLAESLPALRTGEAIISGESLVLPVRALIEAPNPRPLARRPQLGAVARNPGHAGLGSSTPHLAWHLLKLRNLTLNLEWQPVESKRIVAEAYMAETETIYVRFPNGVEWYYENCPFDVWEAFTEQGQSRGGFIHHHLNAKPNGRYA